MIRVIWTESAAEQFALIRRLDLRLRVYRAVAGLAAFPERGRIPPEVARFPEMKLASELREIVFPGLVRVFYRFAPAVERVYVLGMAFRGQDVGEDWLGDLLKE